MVEQHELSTLGISEPEEQVYYGLLDHPGVTAMELARATGLSRRRLPSLLVAIETKGLATHAPERPRRYFPVSPDIALEALVLKQQEDLQRVRARIHVLRQRTLERPKPSEQEQVVELITNADSVSPILAQLRASVQHDSVCLARSPLLLSDDREKVLRESTEAMARAVRQRTIVDAHFLELPDIVRFIDAYIAAGEEVRVLPTLPFKMIIFDKRVGMIPLNLQAPDGPMMMLLRSSALLDALYAMFEILWERAGPITVSRRGVLQVKEAISRFPVATEQLVPLLAAGLHDKAIAHELKISASTLSRHIAALMKALEARTRFQLGWKAALRLSPFADSDDG